MPDHPAAWLALAGLGAMHGLNPAMGWLFAVGLGLQQRSRDAVLRAFAPIALGHLLAILIGVLVVVALGRVLDPTVLGAAVGFSLVGFAAWRLRHPTRHFRWASMRVGRRDLVLWSFLMSTAHGAALMVLPLLVLVPGLAGHEGHDMHGMHAMSAADMAQMTVSRAGTPPLVPGLTATAVHTLAMLGVMAVVALLVYDRLGVRILRSAWINLDRLWAVALLGVGVVTLTLTAIQL